MKTQDQCDPVFRALHLAGAKSWQMRQSDHPGMFTAVKRADGRYVVPGRPYTADKAGKLWVVFDADDLSEAAFKTLAEAKRWLVDEAQRYARSQLEMLEIQDARWERAASIRRKYPKEPVQLSFLKLGKKYKPRQEEKAEVRKI